MMVKLTELRPGQSAHIESIDGDPAFVQRLNEFGVFEGETIEFVTAAPLGDPLEYRLGNTRLSLRQREACRLTVSIKQI